MNRYLLRRLLVVLAFLVAVIGSSCARNKASAPSEVDQQVRAILDRTFVDVGNESWCGLESIGTKKRLIQIHRPNPSLSRLQVSEADEMNGVTQRYRLSISGAQYRYWDDGKWSDWKQGIDGMGLVVNAMVGGGFGLWSGTLEKRNGSWTFGHVVGFIAADHDRLESMAQRALPRS